MDNPLNHIYLRISDMLEQQINSGTLKIGDRLPSVRVMCKEQGVSMSTVLQAYYHLEAKGLIESRPQSGYYVRFSPRQLTARPKLSDERYLVGGSTAEDLIAEVYNDLADSTRTVFSLSVPAPELLPIAKLNKAIVEAVRRLPAGGTGYETIQGNINLRRQIARWSVVWGGTLSSADIVTTTGCMNALSLSLKAVTELGDTIVVESPGYFGILQLAEGLGLRVIEVRTDAETGIDIDMLKKVLETKKVKAVILMSNFNNPLGCSVPDENKREIVKMIQHHHIALIEDELYGDVYFSPNRPKNCKAFDDSGLVMWCSSFSKTLAPGYRVGWVAPGLWLEKVKRFKMYQQISSATLQQEAIALFLENGRYEHHLRRLRNTLHSNCLQYIRAIDEYFPSGTSTSHPKGGFLLWVEMAKHIDTYQLYKLALRYGISIAPGRMFTLKDQYHNCMRLSYGLPWSHKVDDALKKLGRLVGG